MALRDIETVYRHEMTWSYFRACGKKWLQINKCTQGSASACGMATLAGQRPEHNYAVALPGKRFQDLLLRWIDDILR